MQIEVNKYAFETFQKKSFSSHLMAFFKGSILNIRCTYPKHPLKFS